MLNFFFLFRFVCGKLELKWYSGVSIQQCICVCELKAHFNRLEKIYTKKNEKKCFYKNKTSSCHKKKKSRIIYSFRDDEFYSTSKHVVVVFFLLLFDDYLFFVFNKIFFSSTL